MMWVSAGNQPPEYPYDLKWDEEHTREVKMVYATDIGTTGTRHVSGPAPSVWVCKECGRSRGLCTCEWRGSKPEWQSWL